MTPTPSKKILNHSHSFCLGALAGFHLTTHFILLDISHVAHITQVHFCTNLESVGLPAFYLNFSAHPRILIAFFSYFWLFLFQIFQKCTHKPYTSAQHHKTCEYILSPILKHDIVPNGMKDKVKARGKENRRLTDKTGMASLQ